MSRPLALHHFTLADVSPLELLPLAAEVGCQSVCVFVESLPGYDFALLDAAGAGAFARGLRDCGVTVSNLEFFSLTAEADPEQWRASLALGAELGARLAVTHIHDPHPARALERLGRFAELAGEYELALGLEFMPLTLGCISLEQAVDFVQGVGRRNLGVGIDALHLVRSGGTPAQVAALDPALIAYAQLCDGPALAAGSDPLDPARHAAEAFDRQVPGQGVFPLVELLQALPPGVPLDVEVPQPRLALQGVSPLRRAERAVTGARRLLAQAGRS